MALQPKEKGQKRKLETEAARVAQERKQDQAVQAAAKKSAKKKTSAVAALDLTMREEDSDSASAFVNLSSLKTEFRRKLFADDASIALEHMLREANRVIVESDLDDEAQLFSRKHFLGLAVDLACLGQRAFNQPVHYDGKKYKTWNLLRVALKSSMHTKLVNAESKAASRKSPESLVGMLQHMLASDGKAELKDNAHDET